MEVTSKDEKEFMDDYQEIKPKRIPVWLRILLIIATVMIVLTGLFLIVYVPLAIYSMAVAIKGSKAEEGKVNVGMVVFSTFLGPFILLFGWGEKLFKLVGSLLGKGNINIEEKKELTKLRMAKSTIDDF